MVTDVTNGNCHTNPHTCRHTGLNAIVNLLTSGRDSSSWMTFVQEQQSPASVNSNHHCCWCAAAFTVNLLKDWFWVFFYLITSQQVKVICYTFQYHSNQLNHVQNLFILILPHPKNYFISIFIIFLPLKGQPGNAD